MYFICKFLPSKGQLELRDLIHVWFFLYDSKVNAEDETPEDSSYSHSQISAYLNILPISLIPTFTFSGACLLDTTRDLMGIYVAGLFCFNDVFWQLFIVLGPFGLFQQSTKYSEKMIFYIMYFVLIPNSRTACACFLCTKCPRPLLIVFTEPSIFSSF